MPRIEEPFFLRVGFEESALKASRLVMVHLVNDDVLSPDRRRPSRNNDHIRLQAQVQIAIRDVLRNFKPTDTES